MRLPQGPRGRLGLGLAPAGGTRLLTSSVHHFSNCSTLLLHPQENNSRAVNTQSSPDLVWGKCAQDCTLGTVLRAVEMEPPTGAGPSKWNLPNAVFSGKLFWKSLPTLRFVLQTVLGRTPSVRPAHPFTPLGTDTHRPHPLGQHLLAGTGRLTPSTGLDDNLLLRTYRSRRAPAQI